MAFIEDLTADMQDWFLGESAIQWTRMGVAAIAVYVAALWIVRTGKKRFLGRNTVFDVLLGFILGSTLARAINGGAPLVPTVITGFVLIGLHYLFGIWAVQNKTVGGVVKGGFEPIMKDGELLEDRMRHHHITRHDLEEATRLHGLDSLDQVADAHFERNGAISIIPKRQIYLLDVDVEAGVQTVRLRIDV